MKKLMIGVDDSKINRAIFEEAAKRLDVDVLVYEDGAKAFEGILATISAGKRPDIIITDINMPVMTGMELLAQLKKNDQTKYIPVLALTTETDFQMKMMGKELGAAGWMTKPLGPDDIANVAGKFLRVK